MSCARPARVAIDLAELHADTLGNTAAGNGWVKRARLLLEQVGPCPEWGYLELAFMACERPDIDELLRERRTRALAIAAEYDDTELEVRALADSGLALVTQGRVQEGFDRLDAALAAIAAGEVHDMSVVGKSFCSMLSSCDRVGDVRRAEEWTTLVQAMVLDRFNGRPRVLHTHCLAAYGSVLCSAGRWPEAEAAMIEVLGPDRFEQLRASRRHRRDARAAARRTGSPRGSRRAARAYEDRIAACVTDGALAPQPRSSPSLAAAVLRRGSGELVGDALRGATLLSLLVEAELADGDVDAARAAADRLAAIAADGREPRAGRRGRRSPRAGRGRVRRTRRARSSPTKRRNAASRRGERPLLVGLVRLELAEVFAANDDESNAVAEARAALAASNGSARRRSRDRARALLRSLGVGVRMRDRVRTGARRSRSPPASPRCSTSSGRATATPTSPARLFISPKTAEHHVGRILNKLGRPQPGRGGRPRRDRHPRRGESGSPMGDPPDVGARPIDAMVMQAAAARAAGPDERTPRMETKIDEIAPDIFRLSTRVDEIAPPAGFTFNQFLVRDEQPFLFHTGMRALFPLVSDAVSRIVPLADLRWIAFAHVEADECGAMNQFLAGGAAGARSSTASSRAWCR